MRIALQQMDKLGDTLLAFPLAALIKEHLPNTTVIWIGREPLRPIVALSADIDEFYAASEKAEDTDTEIENLKALHLDAILHITTAKWPILKWAKAANIPLRIGSWSRWHHIINCNRRIYIKRKKSGLNEAVLNAKLLRALKLPHHYSLEALHQKIKLNPLPPLDKSLQKILDPKRFNLVLHPGSSADGNVRVREWPESYFLTLLSLLDLKKFNIFVTGGRDAEYQRFKNLADDPRVHNLMGKLDLTALPSFLNQTDGLLCGATGPLHLQGLLNKRCLGLYLSNPSHHANRWGPMGSKSEIISAPFCPHCRLNPLKFKDEFCTCMTHITPELVAKTLQGWADSTPRLNPN